MVTEKERKMIVGVVWNCAAEIKYLLTFLLLLCSIITVVHFLPLSSSNLRPCLPIPAVPSTIAALSLRQEVENATATATSNSTAKHSVSAPPSKQNDEVLENGVIKREFNPYGSSAYNFILMSAYRGGPNTFAVMGLASKPLHVFGKPFYQCQWIQIDSDGKKLKNQEPILTNGQKILPDWGYGHIYTVVVINCTFPSQLVGGGDGKLLLHATTNGGGDTNYNITDTIEALIEKEGAFERFNHTYYNAKPKYDYIYCGSPLYGNLSPQRIREWLAYHIKFFGEKSHFIIYDAGGVHEGVMEVLKPWIEKGYVTLQDIRDEERFDGYYHNQFLVVNDCLHKYRFMSKWMFYFDVDEYIFLPKKSIIKSVLDSLSGYTQFTIEQMPMSKSLCLAEDSGKSYRKWGFEKLVFKDVKTGIRRDRKYAVQPRNVFATGIHMSENVIGKTTHKTEGRIMYYHYHGTIAERREPCRKMVNTTDITVDGIYYSVDTTMRETAGNVKKFELKTIGTRLQRTRQ